jgi:TldD protein
MSEREGAAVSEVDERTLDAVRSAALERASELGASHADIRVEASRSQYLSLRDAKLQGSGEDFEVGVGLRVVVNGSLGFASTVELDRDAAARLAEDAVATAITTARAGGRGVELADEPSHGEQHWSGSYDIDPMTVPLRDKLDRLTDWSERLLAAPGIDHVSARLHVVVEEKYYADLAGTVTDQRRVRVHPVVEALALDESTGGFETMRTVAPPVGRGYEYLEGVGWDFDSELETLPGLLAEKLVAPSVEPGTYDLVIDPTNLWLTIHESIGHATELDRALGYEAAYAGTSFATFDQLGSLVYGSELMNITGDRTTEYGLATIGYDDEGVEAQRFDIVRNGILVGYQLDRAIAREAGLGRSNGCAYASSPLLIPIQRMANVSLADGGESGPSTEALCGAVEDGIYIVGDKSWSIDMQRYNFQFTGQRFFKIRNGKLAGQLRDVAYQATTTKFWGSLAGLGGRSTYLLGGAVNCGKGQPGQTAPVSHGSPSALFRGVSVLNTKNEAGR